MAKIPCVLTAPFDSVSYGEGKHVKLFTASGHGLTDTTDAASLWTASTAGTGLLALTQATSGLVFDENGQVNFSVEADTVLWAVSDHPKFGGVDGERRYKFS